MNTYFSEHDLTPYELTDLTGKTVLVLAPHPDDEVFGCGGAIASHVQAGDAIRVVVMTDGRRGHPQPSDELLETRRQEVVKAAAVLGVTDLVFWEFPDRELEVSDELRFQMEEQIKDMEPSIIYAPSPLEVHPDHRAAADLVWACADRLNPDTRVAFYEVSQSMAVNTLVGIDAFHEQKQSACRAFVSQLEQIPYAELIDGLNRYRSYTVSDTCKYAEGFFVVEAGVLIDSSPVDFHRWQQHPMQPPKHVSSPRVSILMRTQNRPLLLREALESVACQNEPSLEVVLVNDGGDSVEQVVDAFQGRLCIRVITHKTTLGRAAAANTALNAARGSYLNFLDDDDLLFPGHVTHLVNDLDTSGAQVAHADSELKLVQLDHTERLLQRFEKGFSLSELKVKNRVPIQAVMFRRDLVDKVGGFDESLEAMEDWDFWIRLYTITPFHHCQKLTSRVRIFTNHQHDFERWQHEIHLRYVKPEERLALLATATQYNEEQLVALYGKLEESETKLRERDLIGRELRSLLAPSQEELDSRLSQKDQIICELNKHITALQSSLIFRLSSWLFAKVPKSIREGMHARRHTDSDEAPDLHPKQSPEQVADHIPEVVSDTTPNGVVPQETSMIVTDRGPGPEYSDWFVEYGNPTLDHLNALQAELGQIPAATHFQVFIRVTTSDQAFLWNTTCKSLKQQIFTGWTATVFSSVPFPDEGGRDDRVKWQICDDASVYSDEVSHYAKNCGKETFLIWLEPGDCLVPYAMLMMASAIAENPTLDLVYADEDILGEDGELLDPFFKPDWNPDLALSFNYIGRVAAWRGQVVTRAGGLRVHALGLDNWDLLLRSLSDLREQTVYHVPFVLLHGVQMLPPNPETDAEIARTMLETQLKPEENMELVPMDHFPFWRIRYRPTSANPRVSLLIPTRNAYKLLSRCVDSIFTHTQYADFEIVIIDNQTEDPVCKDYLHELSGMSNVQVVKYPEGFNFSAIINFGSRFATGEVLVLLNNDTVVLSPGWLNELVGLTLRQEIGAVGTLLLNEDGSIQHAGVFLGTGDGIAGNVLSSCSAARQLQRNRFYHVQNMSAVTGACLALRKVVFEEVGGLNAEYLAVAFNDVDICLRIQSQGYRNIWTPYVKLLHEESSSRGLDNTPPKSKRFQNEEAYMRKQWGDALTHDPAYNPNLSLMTVTLDLAVPPRHEFKSETLPL